MVWTVIGWVLLGLAALLLALLLAPAAAVIRYAEGRLTVKVRVLGITKTVFPVAPKAQRPKKEKKKKPEADKTEAEQDEKPKKKKTLSQQLDLTKRLAASGLAAAKPVLQNLRITRVELVLPVHAAEAADTALRCGQIQMALGTARALLDGRLKVRFKRMELIPDFTGQRGGELVFACNVVLNPVIMLVAGVVFLKTYIQSRPRRYSRAAVRRAMQRKRAMAAASGGSGAK